jgi:hypothetical protein
VDHVPVWLWLAVGWCAIAVGGWLLITGRCRLYRKSGRLCRKCAYDMAGIPGLTCPECGRNARNERELLRRPGRNRWRLTGLVLAAVGWVATVMPAAVTHGWAAGVPDWLLVRIAPTPANSTSTAGQSVARTIWDDPIHDKNPPKPLRKSALAVPAKPPAPPANAREWLDRRSDELRAEVVRRFDETTIGESAALIYLRRSMALDPATAAHDIPFPAEWPSDAERIAMKSAGSVRAALTVADRNGTRRLRVDVFVRAFDREHLIATYWPAADLSRTADNFIRPVTSTEIDAAVVRMLDPRLCMQDGDVWITLNGRTGIDPVAPPAFLVADVRLLLDGQPIANGTISIRGRHLAGVGAVFRPLSWTPDGKAAALERPGDVEIELTGRPRETLGWFYDDWSEGCDAWGGTVRFKPPLDLREPSIRPPKSRTLHAPAR